MPEVETRQEWKIIHGSRVLVTVLPPETEKESKEKKNQLGRGAPVFRNDGTNPYRYKLDALRNKRGREAAEMDSIEAWITGDDG